MDTSTAEGGWLKTWLQEGWGNPQRKKQNQSLLLHFCLSLRSGAAVCFAFIFLSNVSLSTSTPNAHFESHQLFLFHVFLFHLVLVLRSSSRIPAGVCGHRCPSLGEGDQMVRVGSCRVDFSHSWELDLAQVLRYRLWLDADRSLSAPKSSPFLTYRKWQTRKARWKRLAVCKLQEPKMRRKLAESLPDLPAEWHTCWGKFCPASRTLWVGENVFGMAGEEWGVTGFYYFFLHTQEIFTGVRRWPSTSRNLYLGIKLRLKCSGLIRATWLTGDPGDVELSPLTSGWVLLSPANLSMWQMFDKYSRVFMCIFKMFLFSHSIE